jgi:1-deoxy-D-xylulose-5-phosphate synthase
MDRWLSKIKDPKDLRGMKVEDLTALADEIRELMLKVTSDNGGHLASNLGTVELTLALHCVFDTPEDRIVWDVGHQAYPHKIVTGRADRFPTIRRQGGLSGFLRRDESPYDAFGAGHGPARPARVAQPPSSPTFFFNQSSSNCSRPICW